MIRVPRAQLKHLLPAAVFIAALAAGYAFAASSSVETYTDQALPSTTGVSSGQPLNPGDLTLQDVLNADKLARKKAPASYVPIPLPAAVAASAGSPVTLAAPQIAPQQGATAPASSGDAGSMLMQGMQNLFGTPASSPAAASLRAPMLTGSAPALAPVAAPINVAPASVPAPMAASADAPSPAAAASSANPMPGCVPQTTSWTKSCAEAGYPETYIGQIRGETRTTCPAGNLQDVWVSNGCVPPGGSAGGAAPATLTSPSPVESGAASSSHANQPEGGSTAIDANCGSANGLAVASAPDKNLCVSGSASAVSGGGPWTWSCSGANGGITVSCAAPVASATASAAAASASQNKAHAAAEDALCGVANGAAAESAPSNDLCLKGAASRVNGSGPWTWACSGANGGAAVSCSAPKQIEGACGTANATSSDRIPTAGLCNSGLASAVTGSGPWSWTCSGLYGGHAATCSATPRTDGVCGQATTTGHAEKPQADLCSAGQPGAVSGTGPWNWTCDGQNGGAAVRCESRLRQNGVCGDAHGASFATAPSANLCAVGLHSAVSGKGPWNWTCSGADGGDDASCAASYMKNTPPAAAAPSQPAPAPVAPVAAASANAPMLLINTNLCGSAADFVAIEPPAKNLCKSGSPSSINGRGPWTWSCKDGNQQSQCATLSLTPTESEALMPVAAPASAPVAAAAPAAVCGMASGQGLAQAPSGGLCTAGVASKVSGNGPWTWTCVAGKSKTSCQADKMYDGVCGASNGAVMKTAPENDLCASGKATPVLGDGPWAWSCVGSNSGSSTSCSAAPPARERVDGACGAAGNMPASAKPSGNTLCSGGIASTVYGDGPWTWTCSGVNGGSASSCSAVNSAPVQNGPTVDGLCGSANGMAALAQPTDSLCVGGKPSPVSGNGPWNWNCVGENSGMTVSCTAPLQPPAPISGVCGPANSLQTLTKPKSGLCTAGIISAVSGTGPWTWSCSGVNGGNAVGCVAPLAGVGGGSSPLPSVTTGPASSGASSGGKTGLTTPHLSGTALPPPSSVTPVPVPNSIDTSVPPQSPDLPEDSQDIAPPPVRDFIQPAPALHSGVMPLSSGLSSRLALGDDLSSIAFAPGKDGFSLDATAKLDRLADIMVKNGGVRITLTAYADSSNSTPREARRLSLSRALAVRDYLGGKGVSSALIDVRALGANVPSGEPDRVDIKAN